jgi:hypothetical protein
LVVVFGFLLLLLLCYFFVLNNGHSACCKLAVFSAGSSLWCTADGVGESAVAIGGSDFFVESADDAVGVAGYAKR